MADSPFETMLNPAPPSAAKSTGTEAAAFKLKLKKPIEDRIRVLEQKVAHLEKDEREEPWHGHTNPVTPPASEGVLSEAENPLIWLLTLSHEKSPVIDEGEARVGPCHGVQLGDGTGLYYHKGIMGPLDESQVAMYCVDKEVKKITDAQRMRIGAFKAASETCAAQVGSGGSGAQIVEQVSCLRRELAAKGINV